MSNLQTPDVTDYASATTYLAGRASARLCHNTTIRRDGDDIAVRYHDTDIITYHADGRTTLRDGGWATVTTVLRLNRLTPLNVRANGRYPQDDPADHRVEIRVDDELVGTLRQFCDDSVEV